jgi:hypothetical protein
MDGKTVHKLASKAPTLTRKLNLAKFETAKGSSFRNQVLWLGLLPIVWMVDLNGGITKFGFTQTAFEEDYKVRPDYTTQTLFFAHRQHVPEFKHF